VIDVLYFSDKQVKARLFARAKMAKRLTLVTVIPPHRAAKAVTRLEPFSSLERDWSDVLDLVLVVDEGKAEGMWRDPVVDLADSLYPSDSKAAYAAARGYVFVRNGRAKATVKKRNDAAEDLWFLEEVLSKLDDSVPPPDPATKPGREKSGAESGARAKVKRTPRAEKTMEDTGEPAVNEADAFTLLGITPDATLAEAKRAWRALIVLYHPDKVAHLAPEFRALAEDKTRALMDAWNQVQLILGGTLK
jgi:hypothetical protein